jgi:hypothetical protein
MQICLASPEDKPEIAGLLERSQVLGGPVNPDIILPYGIGHPLHPKGLIASFIAVSGEKIVGHAAVKEMDELYIPLWQRASSGKSHPPLEMAHEFVASGPDVEDIWIALSKRRLTYIRAKAARPVAAELNSHQHKGRIFEDSEAVEAVPGTLELGRFSLLVFDLTDKT